MDKVKIGDNEYRLPIWCTTTKILSPFTETSPNMSERNFVTNEDITTALNELASLRAERDGLKARVETRDALINVMAPMHQLTCRNHKTCPICKAYDKYSKEIDGEPVNTTPGGDE